MRWRKNGKWIVQFRRGLAGEFVQQWNSLREELEMVQLSAERDVVKWVLEKSGSYTTKLLYRQTSFGGVISRRMNEIWGSRLPLKVRIFLWQMFHDKLQTVEQLKKKNWKGEINCVLCGRVEDVNHIMFRCVSSRFLWADVKEGLGWREAPVSLEDYIANWLSGRRHPSSKLLVFGLGVVCLALWKA
jgi:hypothetical protein